MSMACSRSTVWSHDAGQPHDAGPATNWTFPPIGRDANSVDTTITRPDSGVQSWAETRRFPPLDGYTGSQRHAALAIQSNGLPCVAFSSASGLEYACLEDVATADAGHDAGEAQQAWQREVLRPHPDNAVLGAQIALIFDDQGQPRIAARQLPQRTAHLFMRQDEGWHSEEIPVPLGGRDPQLFWQDQSLWVVHSSDETEVAPTLWLSHREADAQWTHTPLMQAYDALPGWFHHSRLDQQTVSFCAFEPAAHQITWGRTDRPQASNNDAGPGAPDAAHDAGNPTVLAVHHGGPFCALDGEQLYANSDQEGPIRRTDREGSSEQLARFGPFRLLQHAGVLWVVSQQNGQLMIGQPNQAAFALAPLSAHDRPMVAMDEHGLIGLIDSTAHDRLELAAWRLEN